MLLSALNSSNCGSFQQFERWSTRIASCTVPSSTTTKLLDSGEYCQRCAYGPLNRDHYKLQWPDYLYLNFLNISAIRRRSRAHNGHRRILA